MAFYGPTGYTGKFRTREVDHLKGRRVHAYACGYTLCDTVKFQARLVDVVRGRRVYAMASECWEWNDPSDPLEFVHPELNPPHGVPTKLRVVLDNGISSDAKAIQCFGDNTCPDALLEYQSGSDDWQGLFTLVGGATLNLRLYYDTGAAKWYFEFSGCETDSAEAFVTCTQPMRWTGQGLQIDSSCCPTVLTPLPDVAFTIYAYTVPRYVARLIGTYAGRRLYSYLTCCAVQECDIPDCCECALSPYQWTLPVSGVTTPSAAQCPDANGNWTLTLQTISGGQCQWASPPGSGGVPASGMWQLQCRNATRDFLLATQNGMAVANYTLGFDDWNCLGPNTLNRVFAVGCTNWPATLTITPV